MKKIQPYLIAAIVIGLLAFIKIKFLTQENTRANGKGKDGKKPATTVTVFVAGSQKVENKIYANGNIVANEQADLKVEAGGRIVYMNLPEGKEVKAGTLLLKVNASDLQAQFEKIKTQLKLAIETEQRERKVLQAEGISRQEYETTLSNLLSLRADSAYMQAQIAKTELYAPFSGIIGIRSVSQGSYITSAQMVATIYQTDPVKIEFSLPEKYAGLFKLGSPVSFEMEGQAQCYKGVIAVKDPFIDLSTRSARFRAVSRNPNGALLPGAFVRVELALNSQPGALFIPTEAVVPVAKGKKVFIVKKGSAEEAFIETGIRTEDYVQVLSGLANGDSVVVTGNLLLKKGAPVKVKNN